MSTRKTAAVLGATFAVSLAAGSAFAAKGCDMEGNCFEMLDSFTYGGDATGGYAGGKIATGAKDPGVCGTFGGSSCSMPHLQK